MNQKLWVIRRVSKARPRDNEGDWLCVRNARCGTGPSAVRGRRPGLENLLLDHSAGMPVVVEPGVHQIARPWT